VSYETLGPVFDNDFGMLFFFKIEDSIDLNYYPIIWEDC